MYRIFEKKGPIDVPGSLILRPMFAAHPYNHFCTEYPPPQLHLKFQNHFWKFWDNLSSIF